MTPTKLDDALTGCSAEPIHIPGAIQPFGVLFALQGNGSTVSDLLVAQHSQNAGELMDAGARLVGRRIGDLFDLVHCAPSKLATFKPRSRSSSRRGRPEPSTCGRLSFIATEDS